MSKLVLKTYFVLVTILDLIKTQGHMKYHSPYYEVHYTTLTIFIDI